MDGWIKLLRKFLDWEWFQKPEMVQLFVYLLLKVNYAPVKWQGIELKAGQIAISKSKITNETGLTEQVVKTCLKRLVSTNEITIESTNRYSIITICNYDNYQLNDNACNQQITNEQPTNNRQITNEQPTDNQRTTNGKPTIIIRSKEEKEEKEERNILSRKLDNISSPLNGEEAFMPTPTGEAIQNKTQSEEVVQVVQPEPSPRKKPLPFKKIVEMWNATCTSYPKILTFSEARRNKIRIRIEEMGGIEKAMPILETIFKKMQESKFLQGESKSGWKASFDWVFENGKNWVKVWEGNYDEKKNGKPVSTENPKTVNDIWENR